MPDPVKRFARLELARVGPGRIAGSFAVVTRRCGATGPPRPGPGPASAPSSRCGLNRLDLVFFSPVCVCACVRACSCVCVCVRVRARMPLACFVWLCVPARDVCVGNRLPAYKGARGCARRVPEHQKDTIATMGSAGSH